MRYIIGCLAILGLVILLMVGSCFGLIGYGIASMPAIPAYATRASIEKRYGGDLHAIDNALGSGKESSLNASLSSDIIAIYSDGKDVLNRYRITSESYRLSNGVGIGTLQSNAKTFECVVYAMKFGDSKCRVFIIDHNKPSR
jgi:hypothetical protein